MNLILHQFRTDVRHFRWRLGALWLLFAAEAALTVIHSLAGAGLGATHFFIELGQAACALTLVASVVLADPLVGTGAGWLTRPLRRAHLFWAKTAFVIVCLFAPWLALQCLSWVMRGYSPHLVLAAAEESLLYSVPFVLVVAVLAALTWDTARFYLAVGITIGGIFAGSVLVEMLIRAHVLQQASLLGRETERMRSAEVVAWLILGAAGLFAWVSQARRGNWRNAALALAAGLFAFPLITAVWSKNFLAPRLMPPSVPLTLSLLETNQPVVSNPQHQLLAEELAVAGVPPQHIAVMQDLSANIVFQGDRNTTPLQRTPFVTYNRRARPGESSGQNDFYRTVEAWFPADIIWFNDNFNNGIASAFYSQYVYKRFPKGPAPGQLDGVVTVDLFGVKKVAEEPLQFTTFQALPGLRVTIQKVRLADGVISVSLDECGASLMFDRDVDTTEPDNNRQPYCTYVLYHPGSGEAFIVQERNVQQEFPALLSGESHLSLEINFPYPALREKLAGVTAAEWLREARLCVFAPVYAGTTQLTFHDDNYHWPVGYDGNARHQQEKLDDAQAITHAVLPDHPTAAQLETYLDEILLNMPGFWDAALSKTAQKKLEALGTNGLPALLRRLPLSQNLEYGFVFPAISKLLTRDQLPELRNALQRDNNVMTLFREKHWEADARDVAVAKLSDHREPLNPDELRIVAEAKDPATYAKLRWHFVRLSYGQEDVFRALEKCPGFDTAGAVREAWQNARLGIISPKGLATLAARQNLPEALDLAVVGIETTGDVYTQQRELAQLASLTGYNGPTNDTLPWLTANLTRFQFDPAQQRYVLEPAR